MMQPDRRWPRWLVFLGGFVLAVTFFTKMHPSIFGSTRSSFEFVIEAGPRALRSGLSRDAIEGLTTAAILSLPHGFGMLVALEALRFMLRPGQTGARVRTALRAVLLTWVAAFFLVTVLLRGTGEMPARVFCSVAIGLILLGQVLFPRYWPAPTNDAAIRRGGILGALISLGWFGFLAFSLGPEYPGFWYPLVASLLVLAGFGFRPRHSADPLAGE